MSKTGDTPMDESTSPVRPRPKVCAGSGKRVSGSPSSAFPEVRCPNCEASLRPVLDDPVLGRYKMRSHRPLGAWTR